MAGMIQQQVAKNTGVAPRPASVNQMMNNILDGEKLRGRFDELLGKRAPQFISSIVTLINADAKLQQAFHEAPMTVIQSALKAATFDLPIDQNLGYAYIVPFKNYKKDLKRKVMEASFILGWKGMHQLALRTGVYKTINVVDLREGELKKYNRLTEEVEIDFIEDESEREQRPVIGYVGYYRLVNGAEKTIYMSVKAIENHEKKFRKGEYQGKGWQDDWDAMARKTVYRQLIGKWGVMSIEYQNAKAAQAMTQMMAEEALPVLPTEVDGAVDADYSDDGDIGIICVDEATGEMVFVDTDDGQETIGG
ncbi:MAG: recombinase RecT [Oscillospiraceae bacterium]|nr:recombinase RecT [Oscillospiraceae bacterium]